MSEIIEKIVYIGDGVYAKPMPNGGVDLMANSHENPTDRIWLDVNVIANLNDLLVRYKAKHTCAADSTNQPMLPNID